MTESDLQRIEHATQRPLSAAVRRFFLNYPSGLRNTTRDMGTDQDGQPYRECPADNELVEDADGIISMNRPVALGGSQLPDWLPNRLVVGCGGCGETYWVDLDSASGAVYRFDSMPEDSEPMADSLEQFAENLIAEYRGG